jgi:HK97 family phage major capsid protein
MKPNINSLRRKHSGVLKDRETLVQVALDAGRGLTPEETAKDDALKLEAETLASTITRAEALERELAASARPIDDEGSEAVNGRSSGKKFSGLGDFLSAVVRAEHPSSRFVDPRLTIQAAASGGSEGVPSDGGFLVPGDIAAGILTQAYEVGQLAGKVNRVPVSGNRLTINASAETSRATGSRWGGVQVYREGEADTPTGKKPTFRKMDLVLKKLMGIAYATDELLADVPAMESIYQKAFSEEIAWVIDNEIYDGNGAGQMVGILRSPSLVSVAKETGQAAKSIVAENLVNMYARMPARLLGGAQWLMNVDAFPTLMLSGVIVGLGGSPAFLSGGLAPAPGGVILGRPVNFIEQAKTVGTVGDIVFANLSEYVMIEKAGGGADWQSSIHVRFIYDEMTFRITVRNDGQPSWDVAVTPANGTNKQSPFVALATRA